jgi:hypothetical protein
LRSAGQTLLEAVRTQFGFADAIEYLACAVERLAGFVEQPARCLESGDDGICLRHFSVPHY